jgi:hypothetical protein
MSAQAMGLKSKPAMAVIAVMFAIVVIANVATFKPGKKSPRQPDVRLQASQPMPIDLLSLRLESTIPAENLAAWANRGAPELERDPFGNAHSYQPLEVSPDSVAAVEPVVAWQCNAVLLSGRDPVAIVNGKSLRIGEKVDGLLVAAIGTTGVKLTSTNGESTFLPVQAERDFAGQARIVNENSHKKSRGNTRLVEHSRVGRN